MQSLQLCEDQGIPGKLKDVFAALCLRYLRLIWRSGLSPVVNRNRGKDGGQGSYKEHMNKDCIKS